MLFQQLRRNYTWKHVKAKPYICKELKYRITDTEVVSIWNIDSQVFKHNIKQKSGHSDWVKRTNSTAGKSLHFPKFISAYSYQPEMELSGWGNFTFPRVILYYQLKNASVAFYRPKGSPLYCIFPFIYLCCRNSLNYSSWTKCFWYLKRLRLSKL